MLFLDRVASMVIQTIIKTGQFDSESEFTRLEENLETNNLELSYVCLGNVGQFLVARQSVDEQTMRDAIAKGILRKELNKYWENWRGEGEVSIAVRLDADVDLPKLYTYLPMGDQASAPFQGYLHGSFFSDLRSQEFRCANSIE